MDLEKITVKYFIENEFCKEPDQASEDAAGYDLYGAKTLTLFKNQKVFMERFFQGLVF